MRRRILCKIGMLAVGLYRFIRYTNNSALVAKVEDKTGIVQRIPSFHLLPCLSLPVQVRIDHLPVFIIYKVAGECSKGKVSLIKPPEPLVGIPSVLGYPVAPVEGIEWSLSYIMLSDSNDEQLLGKV